MSHSRRLQRAVFWVILTALAYLHANAYLRLNTPYPAVFATALSLAFLAILAIARYSGGRIDSWLAQLPRALRRRPLLWWALLLLLIPWALLQSEMQSPPIERQHYFNAAVLGLLVWLLGYDARREEWRAMLPKLSRSRFSGVLLSATTLLILLLGIELALRHWLFFTNSYATGLIHKRWDRAYWHPLNELDFRDYPIQTDLPPHIKRLLVVGDSFAAGFGITDIEDTFPHILDRLLGENVAVSVVAHAGWNTDEELIGLPAYPVKPDILVLSYYLNDIAYLARDEFNYWSEAYHPPPSWLAPLVDHSYLANFLYWNIYIQRLNGGDRRYDEVLLGLYAQPDYWAQHRTDLLALIDWARQQGAEVAVLIWPLLQNIPDSAPVTEQLQAFFEEQGVLVANLAHVFATCSPMQLVVNPFDAHANAATHRIAAETLHRLLNDITPVEVPVCPP